MFQQFFAIFSKIPIFAEQIFMTACGFIKMGEPLQQVYKECIVKHLLAVKLLNLLLRSKMLPRKPTTFLYKTPYYNQTDHTAQ